MTQVRVRTDADAERREWTVEKLVPGGDGFTRLSDGRVGFIRGVAPGDVIRPIAVEAKKGHLRATKWSLVTASPSRVVPSCPVRDACGGCDWMHIERIAQVTLKEALLREALERTGGFSGTTVTMTTRGPDVGYRSRVRFHIDRDGRIGLFGHASHALVEVPGCVVCLPQIDEGLRALRRVSKDALAAFSEVELRVADEPPTLVLRFKPRVLGGANPATKLVASTLPAAWLVSVEGDPGPDAVEQRFVLPRGVWLQAPPGAFTQVNWAVNGALVEAVVDGALARGVSRFFDAYAGSGNFTLPLLASNLSGVSVESDALAVEAARRSARAQGFDDAGLLVGDAPSVLCAMEKRGERFDLVILDPPRAGAREALKPVLSLAPRVIACCSCDPVTLARDLRTLADGGYRLDEVRGFDMFPSTHHLEALAWMSRP